MTVHGFHQRRDAIRRGELRYAMAQVEDVSGRRAGGFCAAETVDNSARLGSNLLGRGKQHHGIEIAL